MSDQALNKAALSRGGGGSRVPKYDLFFNRIEPVIHWPERAARLMALPSAPKGRLPVAVRQQRIQRLTEASVIATFALETKSGRDAIAAEYVRVVGQMGDRAHFDGLFATVLLHLAHTQSALLPTATKIWSSTKNTSNPDGGIIFDGGSNTLKGVARSNFDPSSVFGRGLAKSTVLSGLEGARGGYVMDACDDFFSALGAVVSVFSSAAGKAVADLGKSVCGGGGAAPGDTGGGHGNTGSPDAVPGPTKPDDTQGPGFGDSGGHGTNSGPPASGPSGPPPAQDGKENDGSHDGTDKPPSDDKEGWPNPEDGYPAPDDGGGSPWSRVGFDALASRGIAAGLGFDAQGNVNMTKILAPLQASSSGINQQIGIFANLGNKGNLQIAVQKQFGQLANTLKMRDVGVNIGGAIANKTLGL